MKKLEVLMIFEFLTLTVLPIYAAMKVKAVSSTTVNVLDVWDSSFGEQNWLTGANNRWREFLELSKIPYDVFDLGSETLTIDILNNYRAICGHAYFFDGQTTSSEKAAIQTWIERGGKIFLDGLRNATNQGYGLNSTILKALHLNVTAEPEYQGLIVYEGFNIIWNSTHSGFAGMHSVYGYTDEGSCVISGHDLDSGYRKDLENYNANLKNSIRKLFEIFIESAFGVYVKLGIPILTLRVDDIQLGNVECGGLANLKTFIENNTDKIRGSGFLLIENSGYNKQNQTRMEFEALWGEWGSIGSHFVKHVAGDYTQQRSNLSVSFDVLRMNYSSLTRIKEIVAIPDNKMNNFSIQAFSDENILYASDMPWGKMDDFYTHVFDVGADNPYSQRYLRWSAFDTFFSWLTLDNGTAISKCFAIPWSFSFGATSSLDWSDLVNGSVLVDGLPCMIGTHAYSPGDYGAYKNPTQWISQVTALMHEVEKLPYVRWVDVFDYGETCRFYENVSSTQKWDGSTLTVSITSPYQINYLTLFTSKTSKKISLVTINDSAWNDFSDDYINVKPFSGSVTVEVTFRSIYPTDINKDGKVDILDISIVAIAFRSELGDPNWNESADLDRNGRIDIVDIAIVGRDFGR